MRHVKTILLATDYRPASKAALGVAAKLAHAFGARVSVVHVVQSASHSPAMMVLRRQLSEEAHEAYLHELAGYDVKAHDPSFVFGSPPEGIIRKAEELDADVIVMGAGERTGGDQFITGPVAASVMRRARQPVVAVRPGSPPLEFRRILCPVDFSLVSRRGLRNGIRLAAAFGGELVVLSVVPELSWLGAAVETGVLAGAQQQHTTDWEERFERFLDQTDFADVPWTRRTVSGTPYREILEAARHDQVDLIAMGTTGRSGLARRMMGSVTQRVVQDLPCSILTVHEEDLFVEEPVEEDLRVSRLLFSEAEALAEAQSYDAALAKLDQALVHNPYHVLALELRARVCEQLGQPEKAGRCRRRAEILRSEASR